MNAGEQVNGRPHKHVCPHPPRESSITERVLTELRLAAARRQEQLELVQHDGDVHGVAAQPLEARQELDGRLELRRQQQHLEVHERLLVRVEVRLPCKQKTCKIVSRQVVTMLHTGGGVGVHDDPRRLDPPESVKHYRTRVSPF